MNAVDKVLGELEQAGYDVAGLREELERRVPTKCWRCGREVGRPPDGDHGWNFTPLPPIEWSWPREDDPPDWWGDKPWRTYGGAMQCFVCGRRPPMPEGA